MTSKRSWWLGAVVLLFAGACSDSTHAPDEHEGSSESALTSCSSLPEWAVKTYSGGEHVQHGGKAYECKPWPYAGWCGQGGYEPGVTIYWQNAWSLIDTCSSSGGAGGGGGQSGAAGSAGAGGSGTSGTSGSASGGSSNASGVLEPTLPDPTCVDAACCGSATMVSLTTNPDTYSNTTPSICLTSLSGSDTISSVAAGVLVVTGAGDDTVAAGQAFPPGNGQAPVRIVAGPGNDTVSGSFDHAEIYGGAGDDTIFAGPGPVLIAPGSGRDTAASGDGNDTFVLFAECEATAGKRLDAQGGYDTLISPLTPEQLAARGVQLSGFENVVIRSDACKSDCTTKPTCGAQTRCADRSGQGTCVSTDGGPCTKTADCDNGLACSGGVCRTPCGSTPTAGCLPTHCANGVRDGGETDVDCGADCGGCGTGQQCTDGSCGAGLTCGVNNGGYFGLPRATRVCWGGGGVCDKVDPSECGQPNSVCGPHCGGVTVCDPSNPTCPAGEQCKPGLGQLFGVDAAAVCVATSCPSNDRTKCGSDSSLCGKQCICTPDCSAATAANPDDHCGGVCAHLCANGQACCTTDLNCAADSTCVPQPSGPGICRPSGCAFKHLAPPLCGAPNALCGDTCPACTPECNGRQCGTDPACGVSCGTCGVGEFCDGSGQCRSDDTANPPVTVPDGRGGTVPLDDLPEAPTTAVGALAGQFSVSDEGTAQYNVPIDVPPGRAGIQPVLSLRYAGSKLLGDAGIGWKLEGLSQITRCPRTYALDGYSAPIKNDHTDLFCLDGKRLETVGVTYVPLGHSSPLPYGSNGAEYRTLIDGFSRIVSYVDDNNYLQPNNWLKYLPAPRAEQGPDYFKVTTKDGRILTYGQTRDSILMSATGVRSAWLLNRVEDRRGNSMVVTYNNLSAELPQQVADKVPNLVAPKAIFYTGHGETGGDREVRFEQEQRSGDNLTFGQGGVALINNYRLKRITTYVKGAPVKSYRLDYKSNTEELLQQISECAHDDDSLCKPPTKFEYAEQHGFEVGRLVTGQDVPDAGELDMNGDGVPDFLVITAHVGPMPKLPLGWRIAFVVVDVAAVAANFVLSPEGGVAVSAGWHLAKGPLQGALAGDPSVTFTGDMLRGKGQRVDPLETISDIQGLPFCRGGKSTFVDYDQDGKDDIVTACDSASLWFSKSLGTGSFATAQSVAGLTLPANGVTVPYPQLVDVNGDGLQDLVSCLSPSRLELRLRQGPRANFAANPVVLESTEFSLPEGGTVKPRVPYCGDPVPTAQIWDVDGDGTPELLVSFQPTTNEVRAGAAGGWFALRNASAPRWEPVALPNVGMSGYGQNMFATDVNGDGLVDIWRPGDDSGNAQAPFATIWLNNGGGFLPFTHGREVPGIATASQAKLDTTLFADYDADGRLDILEHWNRGPNVPEFNVVLFPRGYTEISGITDAVPGGNDLSDLKYFNPILQRPAAGVYTVSGDVDADGNPDLFGKASQVFYGSGIRNQLLNKITDGLGNIVHVEYDGTPYKATCNDDVRWPEQCVRNLKGLVSGHTEGFADPSGQNGEVVERHYSYTYENGRLSLTGHGWLGFDKRTVTQTQAIDNHPITSTVEFERARRFRPDGTETTDTDWPYLYPLAGLPRVTTTDQAPTFGEAQSPLEDAPHGRRSRATQLWDVKLSGSGRPYPVLTNTTTETFSTQIPTQLGENVEEGAQRTYCTDRNTSFDDYGHVLNNVKRCQYYPDSGVDIEDLETTTTYDTVRSQWLIETPRLTSVTSTRGGHSQTQQYETRYDDWGDLVEVTRDPAGERQRVFYQRNTLYGVVEQITEDVGTGEAARVTDIAYDPDFYFESKLTRHGDTVNLVTQLSYEPSFGQLASAVDATGIATQYGHDAFGRLKASVGPTGTTSFEYSALVPGGSTDVSTPAGTIYPRLQVTTDVRGTSNSFGGHTVEELDNYGRLVRSTSTGFDGAQVVVERSFDTHGRLASATAPHLGDAAVIPVAQYTYDYLDRVTRIENITDGSYSERQYASGVSLAANHQNWIATLACPSAFKSICAVDVVVSTDTHTADEPAKSSVAITDHAGLVVRTIDGQNIGGAVATSDFAYEPFDRLHQLIDNGGAVTTIDHDQYGRVRTHSDFDSGSRSFTYTGFGEIKTSSDPSNGNRTFAYDTLGRMRSVIDNAGTSQWVYDQGAGNAGRLSMTVSPGSMANPGGIRVNYSYEPVDGQHQRGLLSRVSYRVDGSDYALGVHYDDLGRATEIEYPTTGGDTPIVAKYQYQPQSGALFKVTEVGSGTERPIWQLDEAFEGQLAQKVEVGNGAVSTFGYDPARRWLKSAKTELGTATVQDLSYEYFGNGQVQERITPERTQDYTYDELGRLATMTNIGTGFSLTPHQFGYDAHGNLTQNDAIANRFSSAPHLIDAVGNNTYQHYTNGNISSRSGPDVPGNRQVFEYRSFDLPSRIQTGLASPRTTDFEYTADEERVVRRDTDTTRVFVAGLYQRLLTRPVSPSTPDTMEERFTISAGDTVAEIVRSAGVEKTLYFHPDRLGTPDTITDSAGQVTHQEYSPFGELAGPVPTINADQTRGGFTGHQQDNDLGLIDMGGRVYDPLAASFTSADPVMQSPFSTQGQNRFAYVFNDPTNLIDPSGFMATGELAGGAAPVIIGGSITVGTALAAAHGGAAAAGFGIGGVGLSSLDLANDIGGFASSGSGGGHDVSVAAPSRAATTNALTKDTMNATAQNRNAVVAAPPPPGGAIGSLNSPVFCGFPGAPVCAKPSLRTGEDATLDDYARFFRVQKSPRYTGETVAKATNSHDAEHWEAIVRDSHGNLHALEIHVAAPHQRIVPIPKIRGMVALIHSHPFEVEAGQGVELSEADVSFAKTYNVQIYATGPDFSMRNFNPSTNTITMFTR